MSKEYERFAAYLTIADKMIERGVVVSHEAIRLWSLKQ